MYSTVKVKVFLLQYMQHHNPSTFFYHIKMRNSVVEYELLALELELSWGGTIVMTSKTLMKFDENRRRKHKETRSRQRTIRSVANSWSTTNEVFPDWHQPCERSLDNVIVRHHRRPSDLFVLESSGLQACFVHKLTSPTNKSPSGYRPPLLSVA